ncbi:Type II/IV secretion system protein [Desulfoscipio geothermicus DSM 3669]|uniref:Type II/IV secretion system protein n=2 Tax=Desulfoscipio geothermicus TaxID=39060 RepID=A0A1I6DPD5_9FIRM|nr:Type II/IV secretion system protein [Desulfoscipio geothermicus DSM 3669]
MACAAATQADVGVSVALAYFNESGNVTVRGEGEVTQHDLVADALRMVPKRIVLGECREGEAFDMMQAMNTSHDGSPATGHINMHTRC